VLKGVGELPTYGSPGKVLRAGFAGTTNRELFDGSKTKTAVGPAMSELAVLRLAEFVNQRFSLPAQR
jgi:hypothetical protein